MQKNFYLIYVFSGCGLFFAVWFCRAFLQTYKNTPLIDKILLAHMVLAIVWIFMSFSGMYYPVQHLSSLLGVIFPVMAIAAGGVAFFNGFRPAGYFLAAWSVLSAVILVWALRGMGVIPQTPVITYFYPVAVALESILLSLALADRIRILRLQKRALQVRERRLLVLSNTDGLTKLYNKRYFDENLKTEIIMSSNLDTPLSLLILDLDDFKKVNDVYGHPAGDQVLVRLGEIIRDSVRDNDCGCRYGGEEFVVILPGTDKDKAMDVGERIRRAVCADTFSTADNKKFSVTVSMGLARLNRGETGTELIERADQALYRAKREGKNRIVG